MRSNVLVAVLLALALAGCTTMPPSCDGANRRPINEPPQANVTHLSCGSYASA
jgi:hypothetical protein